MDPYRNADVEYQRFGEIGAYTSPLTEVKLWVICVVIFMINAIFQFGYASAFFNAVTSHTSIAASLTALILNFVGLSLLGNGLFGKNWRRKSLGVYVIVFEVIPAVLYCVSFATVTFTFYRWKEWAKKEYPTADATAIVVCLWFFLFFAAVYHFLTGWIINKYRKKIIHP